MYAIYVVDPETQALVHVVSLRELLTVPRDENVLEIGSRRAPVTVAPETDREEAARLISGYNLLAVPVIDAQRRILGIVTVDDVIDTLVEEQTEDVQRFGGMEALDAPYMEISFLDMIRKRAGWLCALFLSEMLTATAMQRFQGEIEQGRRARDVHSARHELGWELDAGDISRNPRAGAPGVKTSRLVAHRTA